MKQKIDPVLEQIAKEYENPNGKVKIDTYIKQSVLNKILDRAKKEKRNKSEMIRVIIEESFE